MPTYGYRCTNCGHQFEIHQRFSDEALDVCPKCQGKLIKLLYPAGMIFKGSGFYSTDYRNSGSETSGSSNGSGPDSKAEPKPESKPESKD